VEYNFRKVMDAEQIKRSMERIAAEILEWNLGGEGLALVGIRTGGAILAKRLQKLLEGHEGVEVPVGIIDITLYRDDISSIESMPQVHSTNIAFDVHNRSIILVDDVLFTGRTVRAAIDQIMDYGRPKAIKLAVLIDRGFRELPIQPDFVGRKLTTRFEQRVEVELTEEKKTDQVVIGSPLNEHGG